LVKVRLMCDCILHKKYKPNDNYKILVSMHDILHNYRDVFIKCDICNTFDYCGNDKMYIECVLCNKCICSNCQKYVTNYSLRALYNTCKCNREKKYIDNTCRFTYCDLCKNIHMELICAMTEEGVIGVNNTIPWKIKAEMDYFRKTTLHNIVIMGYNTFISLPGGKGLKNRVNIVITSKTIDMEGIYFVSIENVFDLLKTLNMWDKKIFVIGGSLIYKYFINYCNVLHITTIKKKYDGDIYFPLSIRYLMIYYDKKEICDEEEYRINHYLLREE